MSVRWMSWSLPDGHFLSTHLLSFDEAWGTSKSQRTLNFR
jgi:hypothetical protein